MEIQKMNPITLRYNKSRIASVVRRQRDKLQLVYDWHTEGFEDHEVGALQDLITQMGRVIAVLKQ